MIQDEGGRVTDSRIEGDEPARSRRRRRKQAGQGDGARRRTSSTKQNSCAASGSRGFFHRNGNQRGPFFVPARRISARLARRAALGAHSRYGRRISRLFCRKRAMPAATRCSPHFVNGSQLAGVGDAESLDVETFQSHAAELFPLDGMGFARDHAAARRRRDGRFERLGGGGSAPVAALSRVPLLDGVLCGFLWPNRRGAARRTRSRMPVERERITAGFWWDHAEVMGHLYERMAAGAALRGSGGGSGLTIEVAKIEDYRLMIEAGRSKISAVDHPPSSILHLPSIRISDSAGAHRPR